MTLMTVINPIKTINRLVEFLAHAFSGARIPQAVIALSGGIDSATSCALVVRALGQDQVFPVLLPYGRLNQRGVTDAKLVTHFLKIPESNIVTIDIKPLIDPFLGFNPSIDDTRKGNAMARMRMIVLFDQAKKKKALVVGTENKTEHLLGYFTRFGDEASDIEPLRNLYKTQVYELAKQLGIPEVILTKKPTAGLWDGQTDEGEFGFTYKEADKILSFLFDEKKSVEQIIALGWKKTLVEKVKARVDVNAFKHRTPILPD